jgi:hypothetical protein
VAQIPQVYPFIVVDHPVTRVVLGDATGLDPPVSLQQLL